MRLLLAAILTLLPMPALADVTARYAAGTDVLLIEVDDEGNSRIDYAGQFGILRRDGVEYVVSRSPAGQAKVAKLAEFLALVKVTKDDGSAIAPRQSIDNFLLIAKGDVSIQGRIGTLWSFGPERESDGRPGQMIDVVMSADPGLTPVGMLLHRLVQTLEPVIAMIGPEASGFYPKALELTAKGTPLRIDKMVLQSVDTAAINPARFELPAPVISAAEFMQSAGPPPAIEVKPLP